MHWLYPKEEKASRLAVWALSGCLSIIGRKEYFHMHDDISFSGHVRETNQLTLTQKAIS